MPISTTQPCWSQEARGNINGRVTDNTDAVIPGVKVRLTHVATNTTRNTETNETRKYATPLLPQAEKQGFKKVVRDGIELRIGGARNLQRVYRAGARTRRPLIVKVVV
jgi:hypothetical protein